MQAVHTDTDLALDLMALAIHVFKESNPEFYELVDELDLSITQLRTLHALEHRAKEPSIKELSELIGLSLPATSRTVEKLLQRGLVERREDRDDRRVKRLCATESGRQSVRRLDAARIIGARKFTETLSGSERRHLAAALESLLAREEISLCRPTAQNGGAR